MHYMWWYDDIVHLCSNTIITTGQLDYDANPDLRKPELTVVVNDTEFTDEITVNIVLVDINDNTPMFENDTYQ